MSNPFINVYANNPTAGGTDGVLVSEDDDNSNPIAVTLNAAQNQSKTIKLAIRCQQGYQTDGTATIQDDGDSLDRWKFSTAENGVYTDLITLSGDVSTTNTIFWARADSDSSESPSIDTSVKIKVSAPVVPY